MSPSERKARKALPPPTKFIVTLHRKTAKALADLPENVHDTFQVLREELAQEGPVQPEWPHYSQLKGQKRQPKNENRYHCHLKRGNPTWVACWKCVDDTIEVEIYFLGPHGRVPY